MVKIAVDGTMAVMKACQQAGVERCVITSHFAAMYNVAEENRPKDNIFNETYFSDAERPEGMNEYEKSKVLAEKAAWDFQKALPEASKFEIVTINPGFIMGPPLRKEECTSTGFVKFFMLGNMPSISYHHLCAVDVRDVADAHLLAIKNPKVANRRFILSQGCPTYQDYANPILEKYLPLGWPCTEILDLPDPYEQINFSDNTASLELGVVYKDFSTTMVEMADKMVEMGIIQKPQ